MKDKIFAILRTGTFKDSAGKEHKFTEKDLDEIAEKYNSGTDEAPIVVGHPKTNSPAFGWIKSLKRAGDKLLAVPKQLNEDFAELVKKGTYKKISVSLYPDKTLRHVGFLGGAAPAVKGLPAVEFSDKEGETFEFEGAEFEPNGNPKGNSEFAEAIAEIKTKLAELSRMASQNKGEDGAAEFAERLEKLEAENAKLQRALKQAEFTEYLDERIEKGNLTPAQKQKALKLFEFVSSAESFDFSEGGSESPEKVFREFLETLPKQIDFSETGGKAGEPSERELALAAIKANMKT